MGRTTGMGHNEERERDGAMVEQQQQRGGHQQDIGGGPMGGVGERGGMGDAMQGVKGKGVRTGGLEMMTIEEGDREHRRHHHHPAHQHDAHSRSVSSTGTTSVSASASAFFSTSQPIKWHVDWFPDEYYETTDRLEQKQMMTQAGLPDHFNTTPPNLARTIHSAPTPTASTPDEVLPPPALPPLPAALPRHAEFSSSTSHLLGSPTHPTSSTRAFTNSNSDDRSSTDREADTASADSSSSDSPEPAPAPAKQEPVAHVAAVPVATQAVTVGPARPPPPPPVNAIPSPAIASTTRSLSESVTSTPLTGTSNTSSSSGSSTSSSTANRRRLSKAAVITPQGPRLRILVVEDNPVNQKVAKRLLEKDGHSVVLANNGQEALDLWDSDQSGWDVVLMDLHMPIMDGLTATRSIRQAEAVAAYQAQNHPSHLSASHSPPSYSMTPPSSHPAGSLLSPPRPHDSSSIPPIPSHPHHIPIIAVTASALEEDANRCMESGFDDIIHKPIDIHLLSKKMGGLIAAKQERMAREQRGAGGGVEAAALSSA